MGTLNRNVIEEIIIRNFREHHRRIFVLEGDAIKFLPDMINLYTVLREGRYTLLLSGKEDRESSELLKIVQPILKGYVEDGLIQWGYISFKELERIMGTTWDFLIADFRVDFRPNDLGRLIEVVRGGGLIIFLAPSRVEWREKVLPFHIDMVSDPFSKDDLKLIFLKHFVDSLENAAGVYFIDDKGNITGRRYESPPISIPEPKIPSDISFDERVYRIALTQDQVDVIYGIDRASLGGGTVVITADRGRGKSAAVGLGLAGILYRDSDRDKDRIRVIVTSPEPINVKELFNFLARGLFKLGIKFNVRRRNNAIVELNSELGQVRYVTPIDVFRERLDILVVDEASGIPVNLLEGYIERFDNIIFSTTLHGYEGAGRGFQFRFLPLVRRLRRDSLIEVNMTQPIRYADLDPVEGWLFRALFLDSDPAEIDDELLDRISISSIGYHVVDLEKWIIEEKELMRQFIGIYVYAHYRNRPNDIMILSDAPHHFARCMMYNGIVVNSLHLCYEGRMSDDNIRRTFAGEPPSGNLIPTVLIRYYPLYKEFAKLNGVRIVRIATHPLLMERGIGSRALDELFNEMKNEVDWLGSSFGVTEELLSFWIKNDYVPVYLSPVRNQVSGEFSTIVLRPVSNTARDYVKRFRVEFKKLFVDSLVDTYFVLDEKLAWYLLSCDKWTINYRPKMNKMMRERLKEYVYGALHYGGAYDAIREIVKAHFIRSPDKRVPIPRKYEYVLLSKVLQARSWDKVSRDSGIDKMDIIFKLREYISKMRVAYLLEH